MLKIVHNVKIIVVFGNIYECLEIIHSNPTYLFI